LSYFGGPEGSCGSWWRGFARDVARSFCCVGRATGAITTARRHARSKPAERRYAIDLPEEAVNVLKWHVETQLTEDAQRESELLFPSSTGGLRAPSVLNKPFAELAEEMKLGLDFTQRGMRRTFNDSARHARIESIITRSISGHLTQVMQDHYSTEAPAEQRESIARVIDLFGSKAKAGSKGASEAGGAPDEKSRLAASA
jgi:hypothetical protein